jgi:hypothetical protein
MPQPPPPPPGAYGGIPYFSGGSTGGPIPSGPYRQTASPSNSATPSPPYNVDMSIARSWSGGEVQRSWSDENESAPPPYDGHPRAVPGADQSPPRAPQPVFVYNRSQPNNNYIPRPHIVKRDTSNQNETYETKPSIKRAALNRDQSATSNRLKQEYMPDYLNREMQTLQETTQQIRLSPGPSARDLARPKQMGEDGRVTTMDAIARELMAKPAPLFADSRVSTIDVLDLDLDASDSVIKLDDFDKPDGTRRNSLPRPSALGLDNRLTTQEFLDIVTSPITVDDKSGDDDDDDPIPFEQDKKIANKWVTN